MNWNIFNRSSSFYTLRWLITAFIICGGWLVYSNLTGKRIFTSNEQQQWNATGPGYHK